MNKSGRRAVELGKNVLIVLLVLSAIWLAGRPQLYGQQMSEWLDVVLNRTGQTGSAAGAAELDMSQTVKPVRMAVTTGQGRYGTPYDSGGTQLLFSGVADLLNEALSSAQAPERVSRQEWETALQTAPGIYFELSCALPLAALAELLSGGEHDRSLTGEAGQLCLTVREETVALLYINEEDGLYYTCATDMVSAAQLETAIGGTAPNGAAFAFERQDCGNLASYTMLPDQTMKPAVYSVSNPLTEENRTTLLGQLSFRTQSPDYEAPDGMVYLDGSDTLRIGSGGTVTYSTPLGEEAKFPVAAKGETPTLGEAIYAGFALVQRAMSPWQGEAELCLTGYEAGEDGGVRMEFDYYLNGARVVRYDGNSAAEVIMEQGQITGFVLRLRSYTQTAETTALLPVAQAAAAVDALGGNGGELELCYHDGGGDSASAGWIVKR